MDTKEYLDLEAAHDIETRQNSNASEFTSYVTVWIKSRNPELFSDLAANFEQIESQVYAKRACDSEQGSF